MSLQLILGSSGSGKSHKLWEMIIEEARQNPYKSYYVIVPEQFTMQTQKQLVSMHPDGGILNIDILSFERLAFRIFQEQGGYRGVLLEETGKGLVLQKIAQENKGSLKVLGENLKKAGYISQMKSLISEFMQYGIDEEKLQILKEKARQKSLLYEKLKDIEKIYRAFFEYLQERYITTEEVLSVLADKVKTSPSLKGSILAFDGFTGFTPVQNKVVKELLSQAEKVCVSVTTDENISVFSKSHKENLFSMSRDMIEGLLSMAKERKILIDNPVLVSHGKESRFAKSPQLLFLEKNIFRYGKRQYEKEGEEISIFSAENPAREMGLVAAKIKKFVREKGYRFRDFAVLTGDMEVYSESARQAFSDAGIPCFIDEKHRIKMNLLVEGIRSVLTVLETNYSYDSVFDYLRSGLSDLSREEVCKLENYVLALGIRGCKKWKERFVRDYGKNMTSPLEEIEAIRQKLMAELGEISEEFSKKKKSVEEMTKSLYRFLVRQGAAEKLALKEAQFKSAGQVVLEKEYRQIYGMVMALFEKLVEVLGKEIVSISDYKGILEAGLLECKVGTIPPSADQVVFGDMERTRLKDIKVMFFVGVNEGLIPKNTSSSQMLSDMDRELLKDKAVRLAPTVRENVYIQRFYLYLALTKASEKLILSFSLQNAKGEGLKEAYLLGVLKRLFPRLCVKNYADEEKKGPWSLPAFAEEEKSLFLHWVEGLQDLEKNMQNPVYREVYCRYKKNPAYQQMLERALDAAFYENPHDRIGKAAASALYGNEIYNSATRLEQYAACAYAHFLRYGIKLKERVRYELRAVDLGTIAHSSLECFAGLLKETNKTWKDLQEEERDRMIVESIEETIHDYGNTILHSSKRNEYVIERVKRILKRTVWALQEQIRRGDFIPSDFELDFSSRQISSLKLRLNENQIMHLHGRIDRLDLLEREDEILLKVTDYKTGAVGFDGGLFYYGLQLQLMLYLHAAMEVKKKQYPNRYITPAGIFYYKIKDPVVDYLQGEDEQALKKRILKELRLDGPVNEDRDIVYALDRSLKEGEKNSDIIPISFGKKGEYSKSSQILSREEFLAMTSYLKKKMQALGREMMEGNVGVNPYKMGSRDACLYCPYRGVCAYDEKIAGYGHRNLKKMDKDSLKESIMKEADK